VRDHPCGRHVTDSLRRTVDWTVWRVITMCSRGFSGASSRFQPLTDPSVQFVGAAATADPCFRAWIVRHSNRLVRNRHVIDEFVPRQGVSNMKNVVSVVRHASPPSPRTAATNRKSVRSESVTYVSGIDPRDFGAGEWTRTIDLLITNQLLYQLSYAGQACHAEALTGRESEGAWELRGVARTNALLPRTWRTYSWVRDKGRTSPSGP
jgi:hypothetical protein